MSAPRSAILYGEEALAALGLSRISRNEWIGRCPTCRTIAVFQAGAVVAGETVVLRCPVSCPCRAASGSAP